MMDALAAPTSAGLASPADVMLLLGMGGVVME
jgi:hypothetical protein